MNISITDRIIAVLSYMTFGMFSLIWIIFSALTKKRMSPFLVFNLYQAIFLSVILTVISMVFQIALNFMSAIPYLDKIINNILLFLFQTPIYYSFSIVGLILVFIITYLSIMCLLGKKAYVPFVSDMVSSNFGA